MFVTLGAVDTRFWHVSRLSVEEEKRLLFGRERWICQADDALPIRDPVDRWRDKVDQFFGFRFGRQYFV